MDKDNWIENYEKNSDIIEKSLKENKDFTCSAFFSLGLASIGAAVTISSNSEPLLASGIAAVLTGLVMGGYFFMSKEKNKEIIDTKMIVLEKIYNLMPEKDKDLLNQKIQSKQKTIEKIKLLRETTIVREDGITNPFAIR
jgi:hypothetical protein